MEESYTPASENVRIEVLKGLDSFNSDFQLMKTGGIQQINSFSKKWDVNVTFDGDTPIVSSKVASSLPLLVKEQLDEDYFDNPKYLVQVHDLSSDLSSIKASSNQHIKMFKEDYDQQVKKQKSIRNSEKGFNLPLAIQALNMLLSNDSSIDQIVDILLEPEDSIEKSNNKKQLKAKLKSLIELIDPNSKIFPKINI